jgi:hypothetical protein
MAKRIIKKASTRSGSAEGMPPHRIKSLELICCDCTRRLNGALYRTSKENLDWYFQCAS